MIARYLGLTMNSERALADAFVFVGLRHATEPENAQRRPASFQLVRGTPRRTAAGGRAVRCRTVRGG
jgi:hypothetical protein